MMKFMIYLKYLNIDLIFMFLFILSSPLHYYEGFFSFLYLLSIFFLFYVFCCEYSSNLKILQALQHNPTIINQTFDILFFPALLIVFLSRLAAWIHMLPRTPRTRHIFPGFLFLLVSINQSEITVNNIWPHFESEINVYGLSGRVWLGRDFFFGIS